LTWRGDGVNFFVHTMLGFDRFASRGIPPNGIAAVLGGGMDLKIWKPISLRLFEADYQVARVKFLPRGAGRRIRICASDF
jgi:hypothetical protein